MFGAYPAPMLAESSAASAIGGLFILVIFVAIIGGIGYLIFKSSSNASVTQSAQLTQAMDMKAHMNTNQLMLLQMSLNGRMKSPTTAFVLCFFLGGLGAHEYYLGKIGRGVCYTIFVWTFIPALIAFIQLFWIVPRVKSENAAFESNEIARIMITTGAMTPAVTG
jgi:TM2 domain-containing membrane protein YozV